MYLASKKLSEFHNYTYTKALIPLLREFVFSKCPLKRA
jgi:hypothetical protein